MYSATSSQNAGSRCPGGVCEANCNDLMVRGGFVTVCPVGYTPSTSNPQQCERSGWNDYAQPLVVQEIGSAGIGQCVVGERGRGYWKCGSSGSYSCDPTQIFSPPTMGQSFVCSSAPLPASNCNSPS